MFIDDIKNRYTYLNSMKNVVHEETLDRIENPTRVIRINQEIEPVLDKLMRERPTWRFKCDQRYFHGDGPFYATSFTIFDGDEALGTLRMEAHWRDSTTRYYFDNFRLTQARQRNGSNYTTKPDIAAKRIVKAFHLKTAKERSSDAFGEVRKAVQEVCANTSYPLRRAKTMIENDLLEYALRNWEAIKPHLPKAADIDMPVLIKADKESADLSTALHTQAGCSVRLEANDTYLVSRIESDGYSAETFTDATLPEYVRGVLGLLKLVEDKRYIPDVGLRINSKLYFVMDKKGD